MDTSGDMAFHQSLPAIVTDNQGQPMHLGLANDFWTQLDSRRDHNSKQLYTRLRHRDEKCYNMICLSASLEEAQQHILGRVSGDEVPAPFRPQTDVGESAVASSPEAGVVPGSPASQQSIDTTIGDDHYVGHCIVDFKNSTSHRGNDGVQHNAIDKLPCMQRQQRVKNGALLCPCHIQSHFKGDGSHHRRVHTTLFWKCLFGDAFPVSDTFDAKTWRLIVPLCKYAMTNRGHAKGPGHRPCIYWDHYGLPGDVDSRTKLAELLYTHVQDMLEAAYGDTPLYHVAMEALDRNAANLDHLIATVRELFQPLVHHAEPESSDEASPVSFDCLMSACAPMDQDETDVELPFADIGAWEMQTMDFAPDVHRPQHDPGYYHGMLDDVVLPSAEPLARPGSSTFDWSNDLNQSVDPLVAQLSAMYNLSNGGFYSLQLRPDSVGPSRSRRSRASTEPTPKSKSTLSYLCGSAAAHIPRAFLLHSVADVVSRELASQVQVRSTPAGPAAIVVISTPQDLFDASSISSLRHGQVVALAALRSGQVHVSPVTDVPNQAILCCGVFARLYRKEQDQITTFVVLSGPAQIMLHGAVANGAMLKLALNSGKVSAHGDDERDSLSGQARSDTITLGHVLNSHRISDGDVTVATVQITALSSWLNSIGPAARSGSSPLHRMHRATHAALRQHFLDRLERHWHSLSKPGRKSFERAVRFHENLAIINAVRDFTSISPGASQEFDSPFFAHGETIRLCSKQFIDPVSVSDGGVCLLPQPLTQTASGSFDQATEFVISVLPRLADHDGFCVRLTHKHTARPLCVLADGSVSVADAAEAHKHHSVISSVVDKLSALSFRRLFQPRILSDIFEVDITESGALQLSVAAASAAQDEKATRHFLCCSATGGVQTTTTPSSACDFAIERSVSELEGHDVAVHKGVNSPRLQYQDALLHMVNSPLGLSTSLFVARAVTNFAQVTKTSQACDARCQGPFFRVAKAMGQHFWQAEADILDPRPQDAVATQSASALDGAGVRRVTLAAHVCVDLA